MSIKYTKLVSEIDGSVCIRAEIGNGEVLLIPAILENSDYQAYLNKDKVNDEAETI